MQTGTEGTHYSGKLRVRVCGICQQDNKILLIRHKPFAQNSLGLWSPPGGGLHFGESLQTALMREFNEETGLHIKVGRSLFVNEFIFLPLHALEMFFEVEITGGALTIGSDPELTSDNQLIAEVAFKSLSEIQAIPTKQLHQVLHQLQCLNDIYHKGFNSSN